MHAVAAPVVFSRGWFARHQRPLLTALRTPIIGSELRAALGIRRCDIGYDRRIVRLLPHAYVVANRDGSFTMDVRTHQKYAKRLRTQYDAIWRAAHAWDRFVANPLVPALNLGFDTLTVFPDPHPETTTVDGVVGRSTANETWGTIRSGAGTTSDDISSLVFPTIGSGSLTDRWAGIVRTILLYDASALTAAANISAATLSLVYLFKTDALVITPDQDIYTTTPASNTALVNADYGQFGSVSQTGSPVSYADVDVSGTAYTPFPFDATGIGNISKTGISKFGLRNASYDAANVSPTWSASKFSTFFLAMAENSGSLLDPKLVVTYTIPRRFVLIPS